MLLPPHRLPAEQEADGPPSLTPVDNPVGLRPAASQALSTKGGTKRGCVDVRNERETHTQS